MEIAFPLRSADAAIAVVESAVELRSLREPVFKI